MLELAHTHQQHYIRTAEITSTPEKKIALISMHRLSSASSKPIRFHEKIQMLCFLGALRVPKSLFLGVHMSDSSPTGKRPTFYSKIVPKMDPKINKVGCIFSLLFCPLSGALFQRFYLPNDPKMVPKKLSFLRHLTLLKCSK